MKEREPTYIISTTLFIRCLGAIYLTAFLSLWIQIDGLFGSDGIFPASAFLEQMARYYAGHSPFLELPTLAWFGASDTALHVLCGLGVLGSLLLIFGLLPLPMLVLLWSCYLSLFHVGQVFLSFQWDILLLEAGFLAIFIAPLTRSRCFSDFPPPRIALWLLWWLLFRLMFESGIVKLTWNDVGDLSIENVWESLTALEFHYWTQPLPLPTAWYAHQLPGWIQKMSVVFVLAIELLLPFFIILGRRMRRVACGGFIMLMVIIALTGNYNFFNLLTMILAMLLIDDEFWPTRFRDRVVALQHPQWIDWHQSRSYVLVPFTIFAITVGALQMATAISPASEWSRAWADSINPQQWALVNSYGLFRKMTETRPEIVIEGSRDGNRWTEYEFCFKPGRLEEPPHFAAPHQPRIDWQMWFEALRWERVHQATGSVNLRYASQWFLVFLQRLLEGKSAVYDLLCTEEFSQAPPDYVRLSLYQYEFTGREQGDDNAWWQRRLEWMSPTFRVSKTPSGRLEIRPENQ
ncbi:lipase maturation factor family protein [Alteromonas mediterranea]|uniref:lipase maturation factor family protein n=1 Tax=Alteromonas mediterranea TaxID=314275 RepID=UPI0002987C8F|nr:lipase maturation factor family protein [Alteromonas mediterranea]AFV84110.1 hypothetical protein amad1_02900 [Alteromonas mediterranea DE1]